MRSVIGFSLHVSNSGTKPAGLDFYYLNVHYYRCFFFICWWALFPLLLLLFNPGQLGPAQARLGKLSTWIMFCETVIEAIYESWSVTLLCGCYRRKITRFDIKKVVLFSCLAWCACPGRGVSEKVSAVSFCLGSGLFGSCNSDLRLEITYVVNKPFFHIIGTYWFIKYKGSLRHTNFLPMYTNWYRTFLQALIKFT